MYRFFESLIDPLAPRPVVRPPDDTPGFFGFHLAPARALVAATLVLGGIAAISELFVYLYLGRLLDWMTSEDTAAGREAFLDVHGTALLGMALVVGVVRPFSMLGTRAMINLALAPGIGNAARWHDHRYVLRQSMSFFENDFAGRISQKVWQTGNALREAVINLIDGAWMLVIYLVGIVVLFGQMNATLLWPVALWSLAYGCVIVFMVPPVRARSAALSEANSSMIGRIVDSYTNIQSVKLFAHHALEEEFAAEGLRRQTTAFRRLMRSILGMTATLTALNTALVLGTAALSIALWRNDAITVGEIAAANGLVIRVNQMSGWILRSITSLFENIGTVQNGMQTIARPLAVTDAADARPLEVDAGGVVFEAVSFRYGEPPRPDSRSGPHLGPGPDPGPTDALAGETAAPASASGLGAGVGVDAAAKRVAPEAVTIPTSARAVDRRPVIERCSFEVAPGERVGLVGRSGAGKSTLVNLLMRFRDVDGGRILVDGTDIRTVEQRSLRAAIAVVTQDTSLLHRSLRDNIRYGRPQADDAAVRRAAERAEAMDFIEELVDPQGRRGLDAHVGERGVKLSGGQRQRIAIARVILKDAPILVLDEATSALDSEVEAAIQGRLDDLMAGKTVIAVAHRLSTIAALDRLVVLEAGRIVESGSHEALVAAGGLYARLWARQSGGFIGR